MNIEITTGLLRTGSGKEFVSDYKTFERFLEKIDPIGGCWNWTAAKVKGYGNFAVKGSDGVYKMMRAHVYIAAVVNKTCASVIRHTCDNPSCVNPSHLIGGTNLENSQDSKLRNRNAKGLATTTKKHLESGNTLSDEKVRLIRVLKSEGLKQRRIAEQVGVSPQTVSRVLLGQVWSHVL